MAKLRIHQIDIGSQPGSKLRILDVSLAQIVQVTPDLGPARTVESRSAVTLTATAPGATAWSWSQTAGTPVTLSGSGGTQSFTAPATIDGDLLTFQVIASAGGIPSLPGTVDIAVRAHQWWVLRTAGWMPCAAPVLT